MGSLSATVGTDGMMTVSSGPVRARCFGWLDVDQDEALVAEGPLLRGSSERGHRFEGVVELDQLRVAHAERFGHWTALVLPRGSRLLVAAELPSARESAAQQLAAHAARTPAEGDQTQGVRSQETARKVVGVVLALVLLDLFSR
jgi:hypothetical protein